MSVFAGSKTSGDLLLGVHSRVGQAEESFGINGVVRSDGEPDAGGDKELALFERDGNAGRGVHQTEEGFAGAKIGDDDGEFIATDAGERI